MSVTGFQRSPVTNDHLKTLSAGQLPSINVRITPASSNNTSSADAIVATRNTRSVRASRRRWPDRATAGEFMDPLAIKTRGQPELQDLRLPVEL